MSGWLIGGWLGGGWCVVVIEWLGGLRRLMGMSGSCLGLKVGWLDEL